MSRCPFWICLLSTGNVLVVASVTSCTWSPSRVNWGESSTGAGGRGRNFLTTFTPRHWGKPTCSTNVIVFLIYTSALPQPSSVSFPIKRETISLQRQRSGRWWRWRRSRWRSRWWWWRRRWRRRPWPREASLQRQRAFRAILNLRPWLLVLPSPYQSFF